MSTALTYYQTNTASAVLATANQLLANVATSASLTNNNTNLVANTLGWVELWSQGDGSAQTGASVKPGPSGHGWIDDSGTMTGNVFNSGNWVQTLPLETTTTGSFIADIHFRAYKYTAGPGTYTFIAELILSAQTVISTAYTNFVISALNAAASGQLASGEHAYIDCLLNITTNGTTGNMRVRMANSSTAGSTSAQLVTPGYNTAAYNAQQMIYDELQTQYARIRASSFATNNYLSLLGFTYYVPSQILNEHTLPGELDALFNWETWDNLHTMRTVNDVTDFLGGTVNQLSIYNVKDPAYGALGDGTTDDTNAITAANNAASVTGGIVWFPPGTYISGPQTLYTKVHYIGCGTGVSTIKLKASSNGDLFSAFTANINLSGSNGTGSTTGANFWGFHTISLNGNKANQSSGPSYPIRAYGYGHIFEHVEVLEGYTGNILLDWNGGANPTPPNNAFMPHWYDVMSHDCNGIGIQIGGPTDMQWIGVSGFASGSHVCHITPNCVALRMTHCHFWATPLSVSAVTLLNEATELVLTSCQIEGSDTCALVLLANDCQAVALEVGSTADGSRQGRGIQLGQNSGQTPYSGQIYQSAGVTTSATANVGHLSGKLYQCQTGALDERNTSGNTYALLSYQTGGTGIFSNGGYPVGSSNGYLIVEGLTADGSPGKGGFFQINNGSFYGMQVYNTSGSVLFSLDTFDSYFQLKNGFQFGGYSDNGSTLKYNFDAATGNILSNGNLSVGQSASAAAVASSGTITTANTGVARVAPAGAVTGVILAIGTQAGQEVWVYNEAATANSVTFAASGTSHVAGGVSDIIYGGQARKYVWDGSTSLWGASEPLVNGTTVTVQSSSAAVLASSGTITTSGVGIARVAPTGNVTGIIMQSGTIPAQEVFVSNESAFTVAFNATPATSHVSNAATSVAIAANCGRLFKWDGGTSMWVPST